MGITEVKSSSFLTDTIILIKNKLKDGIIDPISSIRPTGQRFVYTAYPKKNVTYPIITVIDRGITQPQRLGMGSESTSIIMTVEVRIWARNVKERDVLFDDVYNFLRQNQYDDDGLIDANLNGFQLTSAINIDEEGEEGIKSKVMEMNFLFICE